MSAETFPDPHEFRQRHLGVSPQEAETMAREIGADSLDALIDSVVPSGIRSQEALNLPLPATESEALEELEAIMARNEVRPSYLGQGYSGTLVPPVIQRNVLENPGWYTAYTPYQAEIAQGRLEALLNFQTMVCDLTAMPVANASLLDEGTAAAEAMAMCAAARIKGTTFFVSDRCHPQTIDVLRTRAEPIGIQLEVGDEASFDFSATGDAFIGLLLQYPATDGAVENYAEIVERAHAAKGQVVVATDLLALTLLKPPGEWGADIVVGSAQRFGVPLGFGGPHAAFLSCSEKHKRRLPGRLVGISKDTDDRVALRLSLQTREQHIRREKATSNICTAQVLLAVMAGLYAVYHGPERLTEMAKRIRNITDLLGSLLLRSGYRLKHRSFFDTLTLEIEGEEREGILAKAREQELNLRTDRAGEIGISLDEAFSDEGLHSLIDLFGIDVESEEATGEFELALQDKGPERESSFLTHSVFHRYHTETEMLRYLRRLEGKDIALNWSMIPLGSCTMKLNATAEMLPLSWNTVNGLHPFVPTEQALGFAEMAAQLESWLAEITGFHAVSLQPNAGSQGEYAGLLAIRAYHEANGEGSQRDVCLIPTSAHGTNPASAVMSGFRVVPVACDDQGNIDVEDIRAKAAQHADSLGALMITYPSTHGVFEEAVADICTIIHEHGGQVYLDGANLNAQVGLCSPGAIGADVCHLNLHKTFCIPHGGGGPGVGPIGVAEHLTPFLPGKGVVGSVSAAPLGSASILTISWMYIRMMGAEGLLDATRIAILNANYLAHRLQPHYPVLYRGARGRVAHECILDLRPLKAESGIDVEDVAKRLIDYGFHAPTMSWPVPGTLMIEPTESESRAELDRFCEAMIAIRKEIQQVIDGEFDAEDNPLKRSPHPAETLLGENWGRGYTREQAAFPASWLRTPGAKYWPPVGRIDNVYGDRNLVCSCTGMDEYLDPSPTGPNREPAPIGSRS